MKALLLSLCSLLCFHQVFSQDRTQQAVGVFNNFKTAVAKKDTSALKYVDETSLNWVGDISKMAITISKEELSATPIFVQYMILTVRHFTQGKDLSTLSQKELFSILIRKGVLTNFIGRMQPGSMRPPQTEENLKLPIMLDGNQEGLYTWDIASSGAVLVDFRMILSNCDQLLTVDHEVSGKSAETYLELVFKNNFNESIRPADWEPVK